MLSFCEQHAWALHGGEHPARGEKYVRMSVVQEDIFATEYVAKLFTLLHTSNKVFVKFTDLCASIIHRGVAISSTPILLTNMFPTCSNKNSTCSNEMHHFPGGALQMS